MGPDGSHHGGLRGESPGHHGRTGGDLVILGGGDGGGGGGWKI